MRRAMNQPESLHQLRERREELRREQSKKIEELAAVSGEILRLTYQIESCEALLVANSPAAF